MRSIAIPLLFAFLLQLCSGWLTSINEAQRDSLFIFTKTLATISASIAVAHQPSLAADTDTISLSREDVVDKRTAAVFVEQLQKLRALNSDEFEIVFAANENLGLSLTERQYKGFPVSIVSKVRDVELATAHPELKEGAVISKVNDVTVDGIPLKDIVSKIKVTDPPLKIRFRDPSSYFEQLDSTVPQPLRVVSSSYLPANARDAGAQEQLIVVERLSLPPPEERRRSANLLDVMEIQYTARVAGKEEELGVVDSSAERAPPGYSTKSIYYVLGQQNGPPGKFPPGWDLTLRGMVQGEVRKISLPYTLAYDRKGSGRVPPFANLVYIVKLVSLT